MKHISRYRAMLLSLVSAVILAIGMAGCSTSDKDVQDAMAPQVSPPTIVKEGTLKVGIQVDNAPYAAKNETSIIGYEADLARALATKLGLTVTFVDIEQASVSEALESGAIDIVMGASERENGAHVWLSDAYGYSGTALFAKQGQALPSDEGTPRIVAQSSTRATWVAEHVYGEDALSEIDTLEAVFAAIQDQSAEYVAIDIASGMYALKTLNLDLAYLAMLENQTSRSIALDSHNEDLKKAISEAFDALVKEGVVGAYSKQWFGEDLMQIDLKLADERLSDSASDEGNADDASDDSDDDSKKSDSIKLSTAGSNAILEDGYTIASNAGLAQPLEEKSVDVSNVN